MLRRQSRSPAPQEQKAQSAPKAAVESDVALVTAAPSKSLEASVPDKEDNPLSVAVIKQTVSPNDTYAHTMSVVPIKAKGEGELSYDKVSGNKVLSIDPETGKVTVAKGAKPGTYTMKVEVEADGNEQFGSGTKIVAIAVTVVLSQQG